MEESSPASRTEEESLRPWDQLAAAAKAGGSSCFRGTAGFALGLAGLANSSLAEGGSGRLKGSSLGLGLVDLSSQVFVLGRGCKLEVLQVKDLTVENLLIAAITGQKQATLELSVQPTADLLPPVSTTTRVKQAADSSYWHQKPLKLHSYRTGRGPYLFFG